jgi:dipeptidyl aminopeptidase/acylaminoacyl peptidase
MDELVSFFSEGQRIYANYSKPRDGAPCVVLSHGLESSKDGNKWLILASRLSDAGYASLRFSYRGCGEGPEKSEGAFEASTLTARIKDYRAALEYLQQTKVRGDRLATIGSSFGGMVALAGQDPRIKTLVCLATPCCLPPLMEHSPAAHSDDGLVQVEPGPLLPATIYDDMADYDLCAAAAQIGCPLLIMHGSKDEVVPVENAQDLYKSAKEPKKLVVMNGANHSFDDPDHLEQAIALTMEWIQQYL